MSEFVYVTGSLTGFDQPPPLPICFVDAAGLSFGAAVQEITSVSQPDGRWSLNLGSNARYLIRVLTRPDRVLLGSVEVTVGTTTVADVDIAIDPSATSPAAGARRAGRPLDYPYAALPDELAALEDALIGTSRTAADNYCRERGVRHVFLGAQLEAVPLHGGPITYYLLVDESDTVVEVIETGVVLLQGPRMKR